MSHRVLHELKLLPPRRQSGGGDREEVRHQAELVRSRGGVFEVTVGNDLIFSKKKLGRFPPPGEVEKELEQRVSA